MAGVVRDQERRAREAANRKDLEAQQQLIAELSRQQSVRSSDGAQGTVANADARVQTAVQASKATA